MWSIVLWASLAWGGVSEELVQAANPDISETERRAAFNALSRDYQANRPQLEAVLFDQKADARQRWVAARALGHTNSQDAMDALLKLCDDPMPAMRAAAAGGLGDLGFKESSERVALLLADPAIIVRGSAADALGKIGDKRSAPALEEALSARSNFYRTQSLWVRVHFVQALGEIGAQSSIPALVASLEDIDREVVDASLVALKGVVGYDFGEGRTRAEHIQAWQRWYASER